MFLFDNLPDLNYIFKKKAQQLDLTRIDPDTSEVMSTIGSSEVVSKALSLAKELVNFSKIKYIGITGDPSVLGVAATKYNNDLLQDLIAKIMNAKQNWENLNPTEQSQIENIKMQAERLQNLKELIAFQVNPYTIVNQAENYFNGIKQELEANNKTFEEVGLNESGVRSDLVTLILASVFAHEGTHANMNMSGEGPSEQIEKQLLQNDIKNLSVHSEYNYLNDFQIIQKNI